MSKEMILIVDDEENIRRTIRAILEDEGYAVREADSGSKAFTQLQDGQVDLVITDVWMEDIDGLKLIDFINNSGIDVEIIVISGHATIEVAVQATKKGAIDFLEKPLSFEKLLLSISNALKHRKLKIGNRWLLEQASREVQLIGTSPAYQKLVHDIELAAPSEGRVLIYGENGSGKEMVARSLHMKSLRADMPMVDINCAAIPDELIESELFGHVKGSFTGAHETRKGKFVVANGGTLFLDEIGDMSLRTQAKVLRVLQENAVTPVGGTRSISADVRIIAATNKNLAQAIEDGSFRQDLYYRLNVIELHVPPLRERIEDIPPLANHFIQQFADERKVPPKTLVPKAMDMLKMYNWPGNVRELQNLMERLMIMVRENTVTVQDIPYPINRSGDNDDSHHPLRLKEAREAFELNHMMKVIRMSGNNMSKAAELLGIERSYLYRKLKQYGIEPETIRQNKR
ncbi:MAG: sigma-54-dependent Fis family transcriptional regulator [Acidobacteria bacterium]|nr:sigma-54-dependent Fis family transcriptional regulator [Acidobacteriota bacterium]